MVNQQRRNTSSYLSQLYQLARTGAITWSLYKQMKYKPASQQAKVVKNAKKTVSSKTAPVKQQITKVQKSVKNLQNIVKNNESMHTHRRIDTGTISATQNTQTLQTLNATGEATFLEAALGQVRYFDAAAPTALFTASAVAGTYSRTIGIQNEHSELVLRNNYPLPANVVVYLCRVKADSSITPTAAITNSMADQYATSPGITALAQYPTDFKQFNDIWKIEKKWERFMQPGSQLVCKVNSGKYTYDPSIYDNHNLEYQRSNKSMVYLVRMYGVPAHDSSVTTEQGFGRCQLDWTRIISTKFIYESGGPTLNDFSLDDNTSNFTNNGTIANKPANALQNYAIS